MKDFYLEHETDDKSKRDRVLEVIKPICEAFDIKDYDYVHDKSKGIERLVVEGQAIGCGCNSIGATVMELINYIWIKTYAEERSLGCFEKQTLNYIKRYWKDGGAK